MEIDFALLADAANVSREGKLNILGAFDRIHGAKFPLTWPRMMLVMRFVASAAEYGTEKQLEIVAMDADGKQLTKVQGKLKLPKEAPVRKLKINHVLPMTLTFASPGEHSIEILINGEPKASVSLEVVQREEPKPDGQGEGGQQPVS